MAVHINNLDGSTLIFEPTTGHAAVHIIVREELDGRVALTRRQREQCRELIYALKLYATVTHHIFDSVFMVLVWYGVAGPEPNG